MPSRADVRAGHGRAARSHTDHLRGQRRTPDGVVPSTRLDLPAAMLGPAPEQARTGRVAVEWALRVVAIALLGWALWRAVRPAAPVDGGFATTGTLRNALTTWSTTTEPTAVHVHLDSVPSTADREWLAALPGAGTHVTWDHGALVPLALGAEPVADPAGVTRVRVAATAPTPVVVRDSTGILDTVHIRPGGAGVTLTVPAVLRTVEATTTGTMARGLVADSLVLKRVLVLGHVGWEARFVIDALEERGWHVDTRLGLAPKNDIVQASPRVIDTARYAAVIALDTSAAANIGQLVSYVRSGGGLVLAGSAARVGAFRAIAPGAAGPTLRGGLLSPRDSAPQTIRATSELVPVTGLASDAVPLDTRGTSTVAVAARRVGAGRVVQVGYDDTWRWRMIAADGVTMHRTWWGEIASDVAYAPAVRRSHAGSADPAPVAQLAVTLGPPTAAPATHSTGEDPRFRKWIFAVILLALLAEWASRRLRGVR